MGDLYDDTIPKIPPLGDQYGIAGDLASLNALKDKEGEPGGEVPPAGQLPEPPAAAPPAPAAPAAPADPLFTVDGKTIPYSELSPELKTAVFDAYTNSGNWKQANDQRAATLKTERQKFTEEQAAHVKELEDYNALNAQFTQYPALVNLMQAYLRNDPTVVNQANQLYQGSVAPPAPGNPGAPAGPGGGMPPPTPSPMVQQLTSQLATVTQKLEGLEKQSRELSTAREQDMIDRETASAYSALEKIPGFDRQKFDQFKETSLTGLNDKSALFGLLYHAMNGQNSEALKQEGAAGAVKNIQDGNAAATETGSGTPAVTLPQNRDLSGVDLDAVFDSFKSEKGIQDEDVSGGVQYE